MTNTGAWNTPSSVYEYKNRLNDRIFAYLDRIAASSIDQGTRNAWDEWHREWLAFLDDPPTWFSAPSQARTAARFQSELQAWDRILEAHPPRAATTSGFGAGARFDTRGLNAAVDMLAAQWLGRLGIVCVADYRDETGPRGILVDVRGDSTQADRALPADVDGWPVFLRNVRGRPGAGSTTTGAQAGLVCVRLQPKADTYRVRQGRRYRALVSVSRNFDAAAIANYLQSHGWSAVQLYETGAALPVDWPPDEHATALEGGHRWLRGDGVHTAADEDIDVVSMLHAIIQAPLSIYRIADLWECTASAASAVAPPPPSPAGAAPAAPAPPAAAPERAPMVRIYGTSWCSACKAASAWLTANHIPFVEYDLEGDPFARKELARKLAEAKRPDPGVVPIVEVAGRLLAGWDLDAVQAAFAAQGAPVALLRMGPGPGPGGLDATIPETLARTVEGAWAFETDPAKLRGLAATMRQGGYPLAGAVLDQRALNVQAESAAEKAAHEAAERDRKAGQGLKAAGVIASILGLVVAVAKQ
jgi:hypothetical protein